MEHHFNRPIMSTEMSAAVTPLIRNAWPRDLGRTLESFSFPSLLSDVIALKSKSFGIDNVLVFLKPAYLFLLPPEVSLVLHFNLNAIA